MEAFIMGLAMVMLGVVVGAFFIAFWNELRKK